jgi:hypothetical protein
VPWTWKTDLAVSRPIMVMLITGGSLSAGSDNPHSGTLMPLGAVHPICLWTSGEAFVDDEALEAARENRDERNRNESDEVFLRTLSSRDDHY